MTPRPPGEGEREGCGAPGAPDHSALPELDAEDLYENAPCGYLSTLPDGRIVLVNGTLLRWLGYGRDELVGRRTFTDLLTVGGRIYYETHLAPLLGMQGEVSGIDLDLLAADGGRLPVLVTAVVRKGPDGEPLMIRTTLLDARDRRTYERELLAARHEAERERARLQRLAATLQRTLLPPALESVPGLDVAAHYRIASSDEVGGDFYDLFPLGSGRWGLFLGDVRGKGAEAAVTTSIARYTLRTAAVYDPDPAAVLRTLDAVLQEESQEEEPRFCTVVFGLLTPVGREGEFRVVLASGGHPPALLLRADGGAEYLDTPEGQLVGAVPDAHIAAREVCLGLGDTLLFYTDGLTEARVDGEGERYGEDALLEFARVLAPTSAAGAVDAFTSLLEELGEGIDDDTAILAISVPPVSPRTGGRAVRTPRK
ncbi:PP2C family protein-serine/threonine phosphatase [Streptomyces nitrosporeus]|uniref:PP2C family protein-serine/threonine phosphatase n=1 Tax=Streptomyces nitrosporeus TaxID=28894 RepID=UPI0039A0304D